MFKRLKASRLDNSTEAEMRRLAQVQLLIIDDFALQPMDATATADFYELVVDRHHKASTVLTSNRGPDEWLAIMSRPAAGPIRRRPAHLHRPRTRHQGNANRLGLTPGAGVVTVCLLGLWLWAGGLWRLGWWRVQCDAQSDLDVPAGDPDVFDE